METLIECLRRHARELPAQPKYIAIGDGAQRDVLTYGELDREAQALAAALQQRANVGDRIVVCYDNGLDFVVAFWGCVYAGCVAVPADPPDRDNLPPTLARLAAIVRDARPTAALAAPAHIDMLSRHAPRLAAATEWIGHARGVDHAAPAWRSPEVARDDLAFLQYTSGSTASPKGVMFTHANVLGQASPQGRPPCTVLWIPMTHTAGMAAMLGVAKGLERQLAMLTTRSVMLDPLRWLRAIQVMAQAGGVSSFAPDFAYGMCSRAATPADLAQLDLRGWKFASSTGERVRRETVEEFSRVFGPCGFAASMVSAWGLTECGGGATWGACATVLSVDAEALSRGEIVRDPSPGAATYVSSGRPVPGMMVKVVDPSTGSELAAGIGELWLAGPAVTRGYWQRPDETEQVFGGALATGEGPFLRTGDLGFFCDGELYIVGRAKEVIIVRGAKHYPADIEASLLSACPWIVPGTCMALSGELAGEERVLVAVEIDAPGDDDSERIRTIRQVVADRHGLRVFGVLLVPRGRLPRTPAGKPQRAACLDAFQRQTLPLYRADMLPVREVPSQDPVAEELRAALASGRFDQLDPAERRERLGAAIASLAGHILQAPPGDGDRARPLAELGFDSIGKSLLAAGIEAMWGATVPVSMLFEHGSIDALAGALVDSRACRPRTPRSERFASRIAALATPIAGPAPLLPMQRQYLAESGAAGRALPPMVYAVDPAVPAEGIEEILRAMWQQHDALRSRFVPGTGGDWQLVIDPYLAETDLLTLADASSVPPAQHPQVLSQVVKEGMAFRLDEASLCRVVLIDFGANRARLLVVLAHHLISDMWSQFVLARDLVAAGDELARGGAIALPDKTTDIAAWGELLARTTASGAFDGERALWLADRRPDVAWPGLDVAAGLTRTAVVADEPLVQALRHGATSALGCTIDELLAIAVATALSRWTGARRVPFSWLHSGRSDLPDGVDLSRTVGLVLRSWPHAIDVDPDATPRALLQRLREHRGRSVHAGLGRDALAAFGPPALRRELSRHAAAGVRVNYLGNALAPGTLAQAGAFRRIRIGDGLHRPADREPGDSSDGWLKIVMAFDGGRLRTVLQYRSRDAGAVGRLGMVFDRVLAELASPYI